MTNLFRTTNGVLNTNVRVDQLEAGRVFFQGNYAFVKLATPIPSNMVCSACGQATWNVHNFSNAVHFCPNKYFDLGITDFVVDFPTQNP